jgi:hypothetical protein
VSAGRRLPIGGPKLLRGVVPGEVWLGRGSCGCEGDGFGGEAEAGEQGACERGVGDDRDDAAASAAGALEHVVCEHALQEVRPRQAARA